MFKKNIDNILNQTYSNLLAKTFAATNRNSIDAAIDFNAKVDNVTLNAKFDPESLSQRFKKIAQVIGASSQLQQSRQVFFISLGGFDNHANLIEAQEGLMPQISRALGSFRNALTELGCEDDVVTFTASDFARTLHTNGNGTDHAWGGNQLVMGGGIDGGKILGDFPLSLASPIDPTNGNLDLGRGRLIPTTSVDELAAELAMWFGVDNASDLELVLPNIGSFYSYNAGSPPLGLFS